MVNRRFFTVGEWWIVGGLLFLLGIVLDALFADAGRPIPVQPTATAVPTTAPQTVPQTLLPAAVPPTALGAATTPARMIPIAVQPTPRIDTTANGSGVVSLPQNPQVNFRGSVQQITEQPQSDGQLHVWITSANGQELRVSVAPGWFLQYVGCPLQHDITIAGSGFVFQQATGNDLVYAKRIVVNGKTCQLRNDDGFALWSNKLR